ncbi:MAG: alpha/beta hydrolase [Chloroflexi bacterium]|nr:alpha/beta hydrolase [Chloroflexota bacterium]
MEELFIDTEFAEVYGRAAGKSSAPLILGIHGYSQRNGWHTWEPLMRPLAKAGFWVVSVDMPGWGRSLPKKPEMMGNGNSVKVIVQILDGLGVDTASNQPVALMGKSWGGGIALEVALQYPRRVSQLILTAPARQNFDPLRHLQQPVLLAWARDDAVIPYVYAQKYVEAVPTIQLETYATGGHSAAQYNAADFAVQAVAFLKKESRRRNI